ncbi:lipocalin family protein [Aureivirga sp. CE67]|uniref:lipocalin family protein n=1 Tax=Aureivirga sp. CE67 TaxID=1788983 RepID=UPI0018CBD1E4|nr:lipocalin family protein [Aureivirga sp. CE67]
MKKKVLLLSSLMLSLISCDDSQDYKDIAGEWKCANWTAESSGNKNMCNDNVYFNFNEDKTYNSKVGGLEEKGTYRLFGGNLYSTPEGKMEIAVELGKMSKDSLQFIMSRSGDKEVLTLVRK